MSSYFADFQIVEPESVQTRLGLSLGSSAKGDAKLTVSVNKLIQAKGTIEAAGVR